MVTDLLSFVQCNTFNSWPFKTNWSFKLWLCFLSLENANTMATELLSHRLSSSELFSCMYNLPYLEMVDTEICFLTCQNWSNSIAGSMRFSFCLDKFIKVIMLAYHKITNYLQWSFLWTFQQSNHSATSTLMLSPCSSIEERYGESCR